MNGVKEVQGTMHDVRNLSSMGLLNVFVQGNLFWNPEVVGIVRYLVVVVFDTVPFARFVVLPPIIDCVPFLCSLRISFYP